MENKPTTRASYLIQLPGAFKIYKQENELYCVPACIKSVLQYVNGASPSQSFIAGQVSTDIIGGTVPLEIAEFLNKNISGFYYMRTGSPRQTTLCNNAYTTIVTSKKPCLLSIVNVYGVNWYYRTGGHRVVSTEIQSDKLYMQLEDPLGGYPGNDNKTIPAKYTKPSAIVHDYCNDIIW